MCIQNAKKINSVAVAVHINFDGPLSISEFQSETYFVRQKHRSFFPTYLIWPDLVTTTTTDTPHLHMSPL